MSESDETLIRWAKDAFPDLPPGAVFRIVPYGDGVGLMADFADGTMRILYGADHPEARHWLTLLLRRHTLKLARERLDKARREPVKLPYRKPALQRAGLQPWPPPPAPYPPAPSYAPLPTVEALDQGRAEREADLVAPFLEDDEERRRRIERELVSGAMEVLAETFFRSDAPAPEPASTPSFEPGGGDTGGAGATGSWDDASSSTSDSGGDVGSND